jgi:hypothetical protein
MLGASRLASLTQDLSGSSADVTLGMSYNAASQALTRTMNNAAYAFTPTGALAGYTANGLNQYASVGGTSFAYDGRGNLTSDGSRTYGYDVYNRLISVSGSPSLALSYDPAGRLYETAPSSGATRWVGNAYVGAIYGSALSDFITARDSLQDMQHERQREYEAAGCD